MIMKKSGVLFLSLILRSKYWIECSKLFRVLYTGNYGLVPVAAVVEASWSLNHLLMNTAQSYVTSLGMGEHRYKLSL